MVKDLAIKDVAERTGIAAGTIRMWEQRYGFPVPQRTPSGYRKYSQDDVDLLRRVLAYREGGLSVPAALERARASSEPTDRPSIYGAVVAGGPLTPQFLRKRTLIAISRAIEDEALARGAAPIVIGAFQREGNYRAVQHRYRRLAQLAECTVVFADFVGERRVEGEPVEIPISPADSVGNEWAVVIDAPGYAACLLAWEHPRSEAEDARTPDHARRFEAVWTLDPQVVRRAALVGGALAGRIDPDLGGKLEEALRERPLAVETPAPGLTALCNRMIQYLEA
ncbi:MAG TPA: DICT sensory domain-containing protein [Solirubrobacteraceae bacterium]|jgi:DICT domain-containing protein